MKVTGCLVAHNVEWSPVHCGALRLCRCKMGLFQPSVAWVLVV